jgi:hypothetical protein
VTRRKSCAHIVNGPDANGQSLMLRHGPDHATVGTLTPCRDGKPTHPDAELVNVEEGPDGSLSCETLWSPDEADEAPAGPAKVTSPAYRSGWDAIWGTPNRNLN